MARTVDETDHDVTFTDEATGVIVTVQKDGSGLDFRVLIPAASADGKTWQTMRADFLANADQ